MSSLAHRRLGWRSHLERRPRRLDREEEIGADRLDQLHRPWQGPLPRREHADVLGTDAEIGARAGRTLEHRRVDARCARIQVDEEPLPAEPPAAVMAGHGAGDQVHRRRADERGHEHVRRSAVHLFRHGQLLDHAVLHDSDTVPHGHRFDLVVRDVDRRSAQALVEARQLAPRLHAQQRVEVGKRLVHQECVRLAHDRPRERNALTLATGQLVWVAIEQLVELEDRGRAFDGLADVLLRLLGHLKREGDVLEDGHVRIERVVLEDHRHVALDRVDEVHEPVPDRDLAGGRILEPRDQPQDRALPTAGRPQQHEELAVLDAERYVVHRDDVAEALRQVPENDLSHAILPTPSEPRPARLVRTSAGRSGTRS